MPRTTKSISQNGRAKTNLELTKELAKLKREMKSLRLKCSEAYRAVLSMCCPKEWYTEEIDLDEVRKQAIFEPSIIEVIESLK